MRVLLVLAVAALVIEIAWLVAAYVGLRTGRGRAAINEKPEELYAEWDSAWSWLPGRIHLRGFRIRGQDAVDQWYGEADRADLVVGLVPLFRKEIVFESSRLDGVTFRLRPRIDSKRGATVNPAHLPEIPGYSNPPDPAPGPPEDSTPSPGRHWHLRMPKVQIDNLRQLWINEANLNGAGRLRGRLDYQLSGFFETEVFEFNFPAAWVRVGEKSVATNLDLRLEGQLGPLRFQDAKGHSEQYYQRLTATLDLHGELVTLSLLSRHLGPDSSIGVDGQGRIDGKVRLEAGRLEPPTRLDLKCPNLEVRLGEVVASGTALLQVEARANQDIAKTNASSQSTFQLDVSGLRFRHGEQEAVAAEPSGLSLRAVASDAAIPDGFKEVAVRLQVGPLRLPDARVLNGFLPGSVDLAFLKGTFGLDAKYERAGSREGKGWLTIQGEGLGFKLGEREGSGTIDVATQFRVGTNLVTVEPSSLLLTNVFLSGVRSRNPDGWFGAIEIDRGSIELGGPTNLAAEVRLQLYDTRPLIALLRDDEDSPGWLRFVPNLKNLKGGSTVKIDERGLTIRDFHVRGSSTELLAQLTIRHEKSEGIVYARYGLISALFDLREDKRDWTIFGAKRGYLRRLAEMKLESRETPEGEDAPEGGK